MTQDEKPTSAAGKAVSLLLALLPPALMAWIVFTNGENSLSNDYLGRVPLVGSMLDGTCSLGKFVREAWIGGVHSGLAIFPIYYLNARLFQWSVWVELGLGLALVAATLALLTRAIHGQTRWLLLPLLSLLLFSTSRVSIFTFGEPALQYGFSQLGVAIGAFALARRPGPPIALALALAFGGILASWSWGGGTLLWPVFFAALLARRVRGGTAWAVFAGGAVAGLAQYAWLLPLEMPRAAPGPVSWGTKCRLVLDLLGRPFANGTASPDPDLWSQAIGAGGLLVLAATLILLRTRLREMPAPLLLVAWGLLVALEIVLVRTAVAPWYASPMALFWAGLLMLLAAAPAPFRAGGILAVALLTLRVQRTWEDKSFYLPSRAPVSAACLREWRTAPPECHAHVFQWGEEGHSFELSFLGDPLERRHLSVFGPRRTYLLQGDVPLGRAGLDPASAPSFLSRDGRVPGNIEDFHRLDLVLSPGATVTWRVDVPPGTRTARFRTVVRTDPNESFNARGAAVSAAGGADGPTIASRVFLPRGEKRELELDLSRFAGRTVKLSLGAEETQGPGAPLLWEAPRIELALEGTK
ncbi:MAG TPA: hypothetical protein VFZ57_11370 [Thermoanaerobaculia bacterium]|nr:hypothetical protein [Thermoanaerobaculia bacterium]